MTTQFGPLHVGEDGAGIFDEKGRRVATVTLHPMPITSAQKKHWDDRRLALAQLFAEAPQAVEALEAVLHWYDEDSSEFNREMAIAKVRAALAKVRP